MFKSLQDDIKMMMLKNAPLRLQATLARFPFKNQKSCKTN